MSQVADILHADQKCHQSCCKEFVLQAKSVAAQDCFDLFYSPLEHLGQLFCRDDWIVRVHEKYTLLLMKEPFAHMFVSSLSNLKADRTSAVKFSFQSMNGNILSCFSFTRRSVPKTMLQIMKSIYPTLRNKGLRFFIEDYAKNTLPSDEGSAESRTIFFIRVMVGAVLGNVLVIKQDPW